MANRQLPQQTAYTISKLTPVQLPLLHLRRILDGHDKIPNLPHLHNPTPRSHSNNHPLPPPNLPPRRRNPRPLNLDLPPHPLRLLPSHRNPHPAVRNAAISRPILETVSVLVVRRGFPAVDGEGGE